MAAVTLIRPMDNTNDVTFRSWGLAFSNAFSSVGLVRTADTGQINWETVARVGTSSAAGYEIYRFSDALQGTVPVFIKIEYGSSNYGTAVPGVFFTVGSGSNGAGVITGTQSTRRAMWPSQNTVDDQAIYFSGDGSYLTFAVPRNAYQLLITIERSRNADGTASPLGVSLFAYSPINGIVEDVISRESNTMTSGAPTFSVPGYAFNTAKAGSDVYYFPRFIPYPRMSYDLSLMAGYPADLPDQVPFVVENCGVDHTYLPIKTVTLAAYYNALVRFE